MWVSIDRDTRRHRSRQSGVNASDLAAARLFKGVVFITRAVVVVGLILATLAALGIVFIVVGVNKNEQINELRDHGVPVTYVVSKCLGLLGGSGSNSAGYSCLGSYTIDGRRFIENLPGSSHYAPGDQVHAISVRSDPTLLSIPAIVNSERASASSTAMDRPLRSSATTSRPCSSAASFSPSAGLGSTQAAR